MLTVLGNNHNKQSPPSPYLPTPSTLLINLDKRLRNSHLRYDQSGFYFATAETDDIEEEVPLPLSKEWRSLNIYGKRQLLIALYTNNRKLYLPDNGFFLK